MSGEHEEDDKHYRRLLRRLRRMDPGRVAEVHPGAPSSRPAGEVASFESVVAEIRARREQFERSHKWAPWCRPIDKFHIRFATLWLRERGYTNEAIDGLVGRWLSGHENQVAPAARAADDPGTFFYAVDILARQWWLATLTKAEREEAIAQGLVRGADAESDAAQED